MKGGWKVLCGALIGLFMIVIIVVIPLIMFYTFDRINQKPYLTQNWNNEFIQDISLVNSYNQCPSGFDDLIDYQWPGTGYGCLCSETNLVQPGRCCSKRRQQKADQNGDILQCPCVGKTIEPVSDREFHYWRDESDTQEFRICIQRVKGSNFANHAQNAVDGCRNWEKGCGQFKEAPNTFVCVQQNEKCPIRKIAILPSNNAAPAGFTENVNFSQQFGQTLHINRDSTDELPLSDIRVVQGSEGVCINNPYQRKQLGDGHIVYPLETLKPVECQSDPKYSSVLKSDAFNFFVANDATDLTQKLPRFLLHKKLEFNTYSKAYIDVPLNCRDFVAGAANMGDFPVFMKNGSAFLFVLGLIYAVSLIYHKIYDAMITLVVRIILTIIFAGIVFVLYNHFAHTQTAALNVIQNPTCFSQELVKYSEEIRVSFILAFYMFLIIMTIAILTVYEIIITVNHNKGEPDNESSIPDVESQYSEEYPRYESEPDEKQSLVQKQEIPPVDNTVSNVNEAGAELNTNSVIQDDPSQISNVDESSKI